MIRRQQITVGLLTLALSTLCAFAQNTLFEQSLLKLQKNPPPDPQSFDFAVIADSRPDLPLGQPENFKQSIREINVLQPAFLVDIGDLILGGAADGLAPQWDEFLDVVSHCEVPFFPVPGNHDISDTATQQIYTNRIGPTSYAFSYGNSRFIMLNTEEVGALDRISDEQIAWLKADLETANATHIFLFVHKPYFNAWGDSWSNVAQALRGHPVRAVFGSHSHLYRDLGEIEGVRYVITGGGGARLSAPADEGGFHHYLLVRVRGETFSWAIIRPGNVLPMNHITAERVTEVRNAKHVWVRTDPLETPLGETFDRKVTVYIENPLPQPWSSTLEWLIPEGWKVEPIQLPYTTNPNSTLELSFAIHTDGPEAARFPVPAIRTSYRGVTHGAPVHVERPIALIPTLSIQRAPAPITIDGKLNEWAAVKPLPLSYPYNFDINDTHDLKARCGMMWDNDYLYLAVECHDNEFFQPYGGDIVWSADNVQLFINDGWEWGLTLTKNGPEVFLYKGVERSGETINTDVKLGITQNEAKTFTLYEAAFPKSEMTPTEWRTGAHFLISIVMNDLDPTGPNTQRHWAELTPGAGSGDQGFPMLKITLEE